METILSLDLLDFLSGGFLRSRVNPEPSAMRRVPSPALVELDPGHQVRGPGLVHRQAEAFVRHLLELGVLQPESANWRRISPDAATLPGWLHQRRRLQLEWNDLGWKNFGRIWLHRNSWRTMSELVKLVQTRRPFQRKSFSNKCSFPSKKRRNDNFLMRKSLKLKEKPSRKKCYMFFADFWSGMFFIGPLLELTRSRIK